MKFLWIRLLPQALVFYGVSSSFLHYLFSSFQSVFNSFYLHCALFLLGINHRRDVFLPTLGIFRRLSREYFVAWRTSVECSFGMRSMFEFFFFIISLWLRKIPLIVLIKVFTIYIKNQYTRCL